MRNIAFAGSRYTWKTVKKQPDFTPFHHICQNGVKTSRYLHRFYVETALCLGRTTKCKSTGILRCPHFMRWKIMNRTS